jgi:hypothetical protein
VIIHGVCCGIGQTTLFERLRRGEYIANADYIEEDSEQSVKYPGYPAHWDRPEFREIAERFVRHNADRTAGIGHPPPSMLETVYRHLAETAIEKETTLVFGTTFIDGAEDLDWAMADEAALHDHSRAIAEILAPLEPVFLYLDGDIAQAIDRAERQRGRSWWRSAPTADTDWRPFRARLITEVAERADRVLAALYAGGWQLITLDVTTLSADDVLEAALAILRDRGIPFAATHQHA